MGREKISHPLTEGKIANNKSKFNKTQWKRDELTHQQLYNKDFTNSVRQQKEKQF